MQKHQDWTNLKNILCIRLDNMGDVLMTTPAIRALKRSVPERKITLLVSSAGAAVARFIPEADDILIFDTPWEKNPKNDSYMPLQNITEAIRQRAFDGAVIFNVYSQNPLPAAMLCYMAGVPDVAGYCRENPYGLMSHWIPDDEPLTDIRHEVVRQLHLVKQIGANINDHSLSLQLPAGSLEKTLEKIKDLGINPNEKTVIIHPGVSEPKRQYPVILFAETAKMIVDKFDCQLLLTGSASEKKLTDEIGKHSQGKTFNLAGKLSVEELIGVIKKSSLLISNNTGPAHIAAATGTPVVVLYAKSNPQHAPWNVPHQILPFDVPSEMQSRNTIIRYANKKAFRNSNDAVTPDQIVAAAEQLLTKANILNQSEVIYL